MRELPGRGPTVAVFDLDGTVTRRDTFRLFLAFVIARSPGRWNRLGGLVVDTARFAAGRIVNADLKERFLVALVGGIDAVTAERLVSEFVNRLVAAEIRGGALRAIGEHRRHGHRLVLATASPDLYVEPLAARLGFDIVVCTRVVRTDDGSPTGRLAGGNCRGEEKVRRLRSLPGLDGSRRIAYSDHPADRPLMRWADQAVAVNPSPRFARELRREGISVVRW